MSGSVSGDSPKQFNWTELGLSSPSTFTGAESTSVKVLQKSIDAVSKDNLVTADELLMLKTQALIIASDPKLPPADKAMVDGFVKNLNNAIGQALATGHASGTISQGALNKYMQVNAVVDMFVNTNELAKIYIKIMRQDSVLGQKISLGIINMAKEMYNLGIQAGEAEAKSHEADARKAWTDFGLAMGKIAVTGISMGVNTYRKSSYTKQAEKEGTISFEKKMQIRTQVSQDSKHFDAVTGATSEAISSAVSGMTATEKAAYARERALADSTKNFLQTVSGIMQDTVRKLDEDKGGASRAMDKLWDLVGKLQDTSTQQWRS